MQNTSVHICTCFRQDDHAINKDSANAKSVSLYLAGRSRFITQVFRQSRHSQELENGICRSINTFTTECRRAPTFLTPTISITNRFPSELGIPTTRFLLMAMFQSASRRVAYRDSAS